jgi:hypothetical protein
MLGDMSNPSNFAKLLPGTYGTTSHALITVNADGSVLISPKAYADDVVAFVLGAIANNPTIAAPIKQTLADFVNKMDARAVSRHGYSDSADEKAYAWSDINIKN